MVSPGTRLEGRYELLAPLGHDDLTARWRARDLRSGRHVEVRIVHPGLVEADDARRTLLERMQRTRSVAHANIAKTLGGGTDGDIVYIVGQSIDGPTLAEAIEASGRLAPGDAVDIAIPVARGLAAVHRRGLTHGRVAAGEIRFDPGGRPRLGGLALGGLAFGGSAIRASEPGGSGTFGPAATGPTSAVVGAASREDDVRGLGIVLARMLTGSDPAPPSTADGAEAGAHDAALRRVGLPPSLSAIVDRATTADPARLYPSAEALAAALTRWRKAHPASPSASGSALTPALAVLAPRPQAAAGTGSGPADAAAAAARATVGAGTPIAFATARPNSRSFLSSAPDPEAADAAPVPRGAPAVSGPITRRSLAREREVRRRERSGERPGTAATRGGTPLILGAWVLVVLAAAALLGIVVAGQLLAGGVRPGASPPSLGGIASASGDPSAPASAATPAPATSAPAESPPVGSPDVGSIPTAGAPASTPAPIRAPGSLSVPARSVWAFYDAVSSHDWPTATSLWSARMQRDYPPQTYLVDRFTPTTRIKILDIRTRAVDGGAGTARVSVSLIEYRSVEPSQRTFTGYWDLVRVDGRWLLDHPSF